MVEKWVLMSLYLVIYTVCQLFLPIAFLQNSTGYICLSSCPPQKFGLIRIQVLRVIFQIENDCHFEK